MDGIYDLYEDENTPPLSDQCPKQRRTPLPWLQISIMLLLHTCEPISSQSIYPYINEVFSFFLVLHHPADISWNSLWESLTLLREMNQRLGIMLGWSLSLFPFFVKVRRRLTKIWCRNLYFSRRRLLPCSNGVEHQIALGGNRSSYLEWSEPLYPCCSLGCPVPSQPLWSG